MSESASYEFGTKVYCTDADCGELLQFVVEPDIPRLTGLVVCSVVEGSRLVEPALAHPRPHAVLLDCDRSGFARLPAVANVADVQTRIRRGDHAQALDGDAGPVLGLVVRPEDAAVTHVLLGVGHIWHRKHVAVPVDYVVGLGFAGLDVLVTKNHVHEFEPP